MSTSLQRFHERELRLKMKLIQLGPVARLNRGELRQRERVVAQLKAIRRLIFARRQTSLYAEPDARTHVRD
jgi:hypothetical protein